MGVEFIRAGNTSSAGALPRPWHLPFLTRKEVECRSHLFNRFHAGIIGNQYRRKSGERLSDGICQINAIHLSWHFDVANHQIETAT